MSEIFIILPILQMSKLRLREAKARVQDHTDDSCQSQLFNSDPQCLDLHPTYHVSRAVLLPLRLISSHSRPQSKVSSSPISQVKKLRARVHMELARGPTASKGRIPQNSDPGLPVPKPAVKAVSSSLPCSQAAGRPSGPS